MRWQIHREWRSDGWTYPVAPRDTLIQQVQASMHPECKQNSLIPVPPDSAILNLTQTNVTCRNWINRDTVVNGTVYASYDSLVGYVSRHEECHGKLAIRRFSGVGGVTPVPDQKKRADTMVRSSQSNLLQDLQDLVTDANDSVFNYAKKLDTTAVLKHFLFFQSIPGSPPHWDASGYGAQGKLC
jgi:hypothetical protein